MKTAIADKFCEYYLRRIGFNVEMPRSTGGYGVVAEWGAASARVVSPRRLTKFLFCSILQRGCRRHQSHRSMEYAAKGKQFMLRKAGRAIALLAISGTTLACILLSSNSGWAADYSVDFGVDTVSAGKDAGTLACQLRQRCSAKLEPLGLNVSFDVPWKESGEAIVHLENDELNCCYFAGGRRSITVDGRAPVSRLSFFRGAAPRGGLFIQNEPVGILYLRFNFH